MTPLTGLGFDALLPSASSPGVGAASSSSWERAFRNALTPNWFHGPLESHGDRLLARTPSGSSLSLLSEQEPSLPQVGGAREVRANGVRAAIHADKRAPVPAAAHGVRTAFPARPPEVNGYSAPAQTAGASVPDAESCEAPSSKPPPARSVPDRGSGAGVHVHVEAGAAGLHVWLGIPGDAERIATRSSQVLEALRRQADGDGQRFAAVTCNGRPIMRSQAAASSTILQRDPP